MKTTRRANATRAQKGPLKLTDERQSLKRKEIEKNYFFLALRLVINKPNHRSLSHILGFAITVAIWPREVFACRDFILGSVATFWVMSLVGIYVSVKSKLQHAPPGHTPGIWHLYRPGEEGIWLSEFSRGWGIWSPCFRGGEFELRPRFHVKSLAWRAMEAPVLSDFRGKD